jgi:predicted protein tyrosine phosphatase
VLRVLFVCSRNRWRSPTAEQLFAAWPGIEVASAGTDPSAATPVDPELLEWAQLIFVMEKAHRRALQRRFGRYLRSQRVVCLEIPDDYGFMDPGLIRILNERVPKHLKPA